MVYMTQFPGFTERHMQLIDANMWQKGEQTVRYYLNDWAEIVGLDISRYKSGNISGATLDGKRISNAEAARLLVGSRAWWQDGTLNTIGLADHRRDLIITAIRSRIADAERRHATIPAGTITETTVGLQSAWVWTCPCGEPPFGYYTSPVYAEAAYLTHRDSQRHANRTAAQ